MTAPPARILRHPDFRRLWVADVLSQLGMIAIPLLAVLDLNASALQVSLLRTCETAARLLFGLVAGAWIDRVRSLPVMVWADLARALLFGSIPAAAAFNVLTLALLYGVLVLVGLLTVLFDVAHSSYPPRLLAIPGAVVHRTLTIALNALSFLWSALWLRSIRTQEQRPEPPEQPHLRREISDGLRYVFRHPIGLLSMVGLLGAIAASAFTERLSRRTGRPAHCAWRR